MVNYLSRFIPNLSTNLTNLRKLIIKDQPWRWTEVEQKEVDYVKSLVTDISTLKYYDVNQPLVIECDGVAVYQDNAVRRRTYHNSPHPGKSLT